MYVDYASKLNDFWLAKFKKKRVPAYPSKLDIHIEKNEWFKLFCFRTFGTKYHNFNVAV